MEKILIGILIVIILLFVITLFWYTFATKEGSVFSSMWDSFKGALRQIFSCFPLQSASCFCGAKDQPCCKEGGPCKSGLSCGSDDRCK